MGYNLLWDTVLEEVSSQTILMINIAAVYCVRQEMDKARKALQQVCANVHKNGTVHTKAVLLSAYIELHTGMLLLIDTLLLLLINTLLLLIVQRYVTLSQVMSVELCSC